jgi:hypothetical protein
MMTITCKMAILSYKVATNGDKADGGFDAPATVF